MNGRPLIPLLALLVLVGCGESSPPVPEPPPTPAPPPEPAPPPVPEPAPEPEAEPEREPAPAPEDADAAIDAARARVQALADAAEFTDAYNAAREARSEFRIHPRRRELDALVARLKEARQGAVGLPFAVQKLRSPDPGVVKIARKELRAAGDVGAAYLRKAVREAEPPVAAEAARTLLDMADPKAPAAFGERLPGTEPGPLREVLVEAVRKTIPDVPPETLRALYARVQADDAFARLDAAGLLLAALDRRAGRDREAFGALLGDPDAFAALKTYAQGAATSENPEAAAWAARHASVFGLVVAQADLVLWLRADTGVETKGEAVVRWKDLSPAGVDATQDDPKKRPTLVETETGPAVRFDGVDDALRLPEGFKSFPEGVTVSVWARLEKPGNWARFVDFGNGAGEDNIVLARESSSDDLTFYVYAEDERTGGINTAPDTLKTETWQHLAGTADAEGNVAMYVGGKKLGGGKTSIPRDVVRTSNLIGESNWETTNDAHYDGMMDDLRVYRRALTPEEMARLYRSSPRAAP